jgi:hypothetical protein
MPDELQSFRDDFVKRHARGAEAPARGPLDDFRKDFIERHTRSAGVDPALTPSGERALPDWDEYHHAADVITGGELSRDPARARAKQEWSEQNPTRALAAEYMPEAALQVAATTAAGRGLEMSLGALGLPGAGRFLTGRAGAGVPGVLGYGARLASRGMSNALQGGASAYMFPDRSVSPEENLVQGAGIGAATGLAGHLLTGPMRSSIDPALAARTRAYNAIAETLGQPQTPLGAVAGASPASRYTNRLMQGGPSSVLGLTAAIAGGGAAEHFAPELMSLARGHPVTSTLGAYGIANALAGLTQNTSPVTNAILSRAARGTPFIANPLIPAARETLRGDRTSSPDQAENEARIRQTFAAHGIDPDIAVRVARSESGLDASNVGDQGSSHGLFQLHYGNMPGTSKGNSVTGLGDEYTRDTGYHASDVNHLDTQLDWIARRVKQDGWGAFHGWKGDAFAGIPTRVEVYRRPETAWPSPDQGNVLTGLGGQ